MRKTIRSHLNSNANLTHVSMRNVPHCILYSEAGDGASQKTAFSSKKEKEAMTLKLPELSALSKPPHS